MKIYIHPFYFNEGEEGKAWSAKNGATRNELILIFERGIEINPAEKWVKGKISYVNLAHQSIITISPSPNEDEKVVGIFLNWDFGFSVLNHEFEIFSASSIGGGGNKESKMGIYNPGAIIKKHTYENRRPAHYYYLTENGWIELGTVADIIAKAPTLREAKIALDLLDIKFNIVE